MEHSVCQIGDSKNGTTHSNLPEAVYSAKTVIAVADSKLAKTRNRNRNREVQFFLPRGTFLMILPFKIFRMYQKKVFSICYIWSRFRKAGRVYCGGARETH